MNEKMETPTKMDITLLLGITGKLEDELRKPNILAGVEKIKEMLKLSGLSYFELKGTLDGKEIFMHYAAPTNALGMGIFDTKEKYIEI